MSLVSPAAEGAPDSADEPSAHPDAVALAPADESLMGRHGAPVQSSAPPPSALAAHDDARALIRLVQCPLCSVPFRLPVTLPCGNSLCRQCLPQQHEREHVSYPDLPGRRQAVKCPFAECGADHPAADCSTDVTLTKIMEAIAETVAKQISVAGNATTLVQEMARWDECISGEPVLEKDNAQTLPGGRLVATYMLAAKGELYRANDIEYPDPQAASEEQRVLDSDILQGLLEAAQQQVDCQVCYNVFLDPVTTSCGHTLCRKCLTRTLDHSLHCPVCRRGLGLPPSLLGQPNNRALEQLLEALCPQTVATRREAVALEESGGQGELNTALFVCTLGFPYMPTFLRIFEPRYRLMLRRCMEGNREFGMLMYNRYSEPQGDLGPVHFYQYGTMLSIVHHQLLPDGTSLIESRGSYRFRVRGHGVHDGYAIGSVERVEDVSTAEEERLEALETARPLAPADSENVPAQIDRMSTRALLELGHAFIERMRTRSASWLQQRVLNINGEPPADPALFPFWFASVLPISDEEKYKLLPTTTVRERLKITANWIRRIESQRWIGFSALSPAEAAESSSDDGGDLEMDDGSELGEEVEEVDVLEQHDDEWAEQEEGEPAGVDRFEQARREADRQGAEHADAQTQTEHPPPPSGAPRQ